MRLMFFSREQKSPKSPQVFSYGTKAADVQYFSLEEPPRSPKITYSTPSPTSNKMPSVSDIPGNATPPTGYFEQRSPKFPQHQTSAEKKFVFDAVSPRRESVGKHEIKRPFLEINRYTLRNVTKAIH